jgi:iron complex transport system permease protein
MFFFVSFSFSLFSGSSNISDLTFVKKLISGEPNFEYIFWQLRLPRALACAGCGALLAWAGACTQTLFRNPLAEPGLLGINAGALVCMLISYALNLSNKIQLTVTFYSGFIGAFFSLLFFSFFLLIGYGNSITLILLGICLNALLSACIAIAYVILPSHILKSFYFWSLGDCSMVQWENIYPIIFAIPVVLYFSIRFSRDLDILTLGREEAIVCGVDVNTLQLNLMIVLAMSVSVVLQAVGNVGFIAIIAPHLVRLWMGPAHSKLLLNAALVGAIWLCLADYFSKSLFSGFQLPVGIYIVATGVPIFLWLLIKKGILQSI